MPPSARQLLQTSASSPDDHACAQKEMLGKIDKKLDSILEKLADGQTKFATLSLRIRALEVIVYGGTGIALIGILIMLLKNAGVHAQ